MVIVLTSNYDAALLQMAVQMKNEFKKIYGEAVAFVPNQSKTDEKTDIERYERVNSLNPFSSVYKEIAKRILSYNPSLVFVCDTNLITGRIIVNLPKSIPVYMTIHDVNPHPNYSSAITTFKEALKRPYVNRALSECKRIVLMSKHSYAEYKEKNPQYADKLALIRLGAHVPQVEEEKPLELGEETNYILFFGRIDKYKGVINLLKAFEIKKKDIDRKVVIAGRGTLTEEEQTIIDRNKNKILLIKRYITDGEMIWLFRHAACTVLPYIEASQSGVLSMSYHFGKPVIVSNLDGLTEFVDEGKTGVIFNTIAELSDYLVTIPDKAIEMKVDVLRFHDENLDWGNNIRRSMMTN